MAHDRCSRMAAVWTPLVHREGSGLITTGKFVHVCGCGVEEGRTVSSTVTLTVWGGGGSCGPCLLLVVDLDVEGKNQIFRPLQLMCVYTMRLSIVLSLRYV